MRKSTYCKTVLEQYHSQPKKKKKFNYLGFPYKGNHSTLYENEDSGYENPVVGQPSRKHYKYSDGYLRGNNDSYVRKIIDGFVERHIKNGNPITLIIGDKGSYQKHTKKFKVVGFKKNEYIILDTIN